MAGPRALDINLIYGEMDSLFFDTYEATTTYFLNILKRAQQE
jgi:hypothetical protein